MQRHRPLGTPQEHAGSALAQGGLLSVLVVGALAVLAAAMLANGAAPELVGMTWALAGIAPFVLLREFARRFSFAHVHFGRTLALDAAVAVVQLAILGGLDRTGRMSAITASLALGASCAVAATGWLYVARGEFAVRRTEVRRSLKHGWSIGKWLFINQAMVQVQRYATHWLSFVIAGVAVTGVYAACLSIVAFANPLTFGLGGMLAPRSALAWKEGGGVGLRRQAIRDALLFAAVLAPLCLLVLLAGDSLMHFLYRQPEYEGHGPVVATLAFASLASAIGMPASNALASMERPREIFAVGTASAVLTIALSVVGAGHMEPRRRRLWPPHRQHRRIGRAVARLSPAGAALREHRGGVQHDAGPAAGCIADAMDHHAARRRRLLDGLRDRVARTASRSGRTIGIWS